MFVVYVPAGVEPEMFARYDAVITSAETGADAVTIVTGVVVELA
jgi:hypothetical protein